MKKLLLTFILSILGIAGILYYQAGSPVLGGTLIYPSQGGTGTSTKGWSGGCVTVTAGVWQTTTCGTGGGGSADQYWMASGTSLYNTSTSNIVVIGDDGTTTGGYALEVANNIYARDKIVANNFMYSSYLIGNTIGAIDMRSDPWSLYGSVDLEIDDGNLKFATTGDAYVYFNANAQYLMWDDDAPGFFFSDNIRTNDLVAMASTTVSGSTTMSGLISCGKLFTDAAGIVSCGIDSTGGSGGIDSWNISGTVMTATDTVRDVKITTASTTLASTTISHLTYASTSKWDGAWTYISGTSTWFNWIYSTSTKIDANYAWYSASSTVINAAEVWASSSWKYLVGTSTWFNWLAGSSTNLMSYAQASSTYLITGTSTAGVTINAAKQVGLDGLVCKYSDASTSYWSTAFMTNFATSIFALDSDLTGYMTTFNTSVFALDTDLSAYMTNFATSIFMTNFATSVFALDTDLSAYMTTFATSVFALDTDLSAYMTNFATSIFMTNFATSVFALDTDLSAYMTNFATSVFLTNQTGLTTFATSVFLTNQTGLTTFATSVFLTNTTGLTTFATSVFVADTDYSAYLVGTTSKETVNFMFGRATTSQFNVPIYWTPSTPIIITEVGCYSDGAMVMYCGECAENSLATSSSIANVSCDTDSASTTVFGDSSIAQRNKVKCLIASIASGTSTWGYIRYTK